MSLTGKLSQKHEADIAEWFHGRKTKASGSQWNDAADGRQSRYTTAVAFAWDCKAAMPGTKSVSITRDMLSKIEEQAGAERPAIPVRFYNTERGGVEFDYMLVRTDDLRELIETLLEYERETSNG